MTIHIRWMQFKRTCCRGRSSKEIAALKPVFYAGATAGLFELKDAAGLVITPRAAINNMRQRLINARFTELEDYKRIVASKVAAE